MSEKWIKYTFGYMSPGYLEACIDDPNTVVHIDDIKFYQDAPPLFEDAFYTGSEGQGNQENTRLDDTLAAYLAAPLWALIWYLTFGKFGRPMSVEAPAQEKNDG